LTHFQWLTERFTTKKQLPEITQTIKNAFVGIDKELREKSVQYNTLKAKLSHLEQSQTGSLLTRDLNKDLATFKDPTVQPNGDKSEYLTTLYVVVPKTEQKNWIKSYEQLHEFVVPRSSQKICEDEEFALNSLVVFTRFIEEIKNAARLKKFTIRKNDPTTQLSTEEIKNLHKEFSVTATKYERWADVNFTDGFVAYLHLKCIQLFVEAILRYGPPPDFKSILLVPKKGQEKKLEKVLCREFNYLGQVDDEEKDDEEKDDKAIALLGQEKFFPYVFLDLDLTFGGQHHK